MLTDVLIIDGAPQTRDEALALTFAALHAGGYVAESFLEACIAREKSFPSGLEMEIPVAIPHTDPRHVREPAVCLLRLAKPVLFGNMAEPDQTVPVEFVCNMALTDTEGQLAMLRAIMAVAQDAAFLRSARTMPVAALRQTLGERWKAAKLCGASPAATGECLDAPAGKSMFREKLTITNPTGLHARPASMLTQACQKFTSEISILAGGKKINPKSIVSLLAAGVKPGTEIELLADGPDAAVAGAAIRDLINNLSE